MRSQNEVERARDEIRDAVRFLSPIEVTALFREMLKSAELAERTWEREVNEL